MLIDGKLTLKTTIVMPITYTVYVIIVVYQSNQLKDIPLDSDLIPDVGSTIITSLNPGSDEGVDII